MKLGILFSGGKDSTLAAWLAKKEGYEVGCLISIFSKNKESFMFHTPSIEMVKIQSVAMKIPLLLSISEGKKESELVDLEGIIRRARDEFGITGIVSGAVGSVYQATRIQKICKNLEIECFNPLWQKNQTEILKDLIKERFSAVIVGVSAYPLDKGFLGRKIDYTFMQDILKMEEKFSINPAGEGGEFESIVLDCPLFFNRLKVDSFVDFGEKNTWRRELILKNEC